MKNALMRLNTITLAVMVSLQAVASVDNAAKIVTPSATIAAAQAKAANATKAKPPKVQNIQKPIKIDVNRSMGNVNGGGGVSAADAKGHRRLLDLIEKDELEYFYPKFRWHLDFLDKDFVVQDRTVGLFWLENLSYALIRGKTTDFGGPRFMWYLYQVLTPHMTKCYSLYEGGIDCEFYFQKYPKKIPPLKWAYVDGDLENINDEGEVRIVNENTKKQVAVQKDGLVIISRKEAANLYMDLEALFIHEAVLRVVLELNPDDIAKNGTKNVRAYVRRFVKFLLNPADTPTYPIREAYDAFGIVEPSRK